MTLSEIREMARRLSRVTSTKASDDVVDEYIGMALRDLSINVGGFYTEKYVKVTPSFDLSSLIAVGIAINGGEAADCELADTDYQNLSGSEAAAVMQTALRSELSDVDMTVTYSEATWSFTIGIPDATSIEITEPDDDHYISGIPTILGTTGSQTGESWTGATPEYANNELDLPTDYVDVIYILWDDLPLKKIPFSTTKYPATGTPAYYATIYGTIRLYPTPTEQGRCYMAYMEVPDVPSSDDASPAIPQQAHTALVYYAASKLSEEVFDTERAGRYWSHYMTDVNKVRAQIANINSESRTLDDESPFKHFRSNYVT